MQYEKPLHMDHIDVPRNLQGEREMDADADDQPNVDIFDLTPDEAGYAFPLINAFNKRFGLSIYDGETDRVRRGDVGEALAMARAFRPDPDHPEAAAGVAKIREALECGAERGTFVQFTLAVIF